MRVIHQKGLGFSDEFHNADATPYKALLWVFTVLGVALLLIAASALRDSRRSATIER